MSGLWWPGLYMVCGAGLPEFVADSMTDEVIIGNIRKKDGEIYNVRIVYPQKYINFLENIDAQSKTSSDTDHPQIERVRVL